MRRVAADVSLVPRPRGSLPLLCAAALVATSLLAAWLLEPRRFAELAVQSALGLTLGAAAYGVCLLSEEWLLHSSQRHQGSVLQVLRACFCARTWVGIGVAALLLQLRGSPLRGEQWSSVVLTGALFLALKALQVLGPSPAEVSEICESRKMNVAHGLAWSFYLGYLKLVLPHLDGLIERYNAAQRGRGAANIPKSSRKIHILLPLNASVNAKLEDGDPSISFHDNLPELQQDRAGVRRRVYKHSVYRVTDQRGQPHYCVVEYATPLLTLYQMSQESAAGFGEKERRQQVLLFCRTLQEILDSSLECRNRYKLILLDDERAEDTHFLSREILKHLLQQEREEFSLGPPLEASLDSGAPPMQEMWHGLTPNGSSKGSRKGSPNGSPVGATSVGGSEEMSSLPSLMISRPGPLRGPEENTDYPLNYRR